MVRRSLGTQKGEEGTPHVLAQGGRCKMHAYALLTGLCQEGAGVHMLLGSQGVNLTTGMVQAIGFGVGSLENQSSTEQY